MTVIDAQHCHCFACQIVSRPKNLVLKPPWLLLKRLFASCRAAFGMMPEWCHSRGGSDAQSGGVAQPSGAEWVGASERKGFFSWFFFYFSLFCLCKEVSRKIVTSLLKYPPPPSLQHKHTAAPDRPTTIRPQRCYSAPMAETRLQVKEDLSQAAAKKESKCGIVCDLQPALTSHRSFYFWNKCHCCSLTFGLLYIFIYTNT